MLGYTVTYLNPLKVADSDSTGVGIYVRQDDYTFL